MTLGHEHDFRHAELAVRKVPEDMHGHGRAATRETMHLAGVAQFLAGGGGGRGLLELAKARAGVGKTPGRQFDAEAVERLPHFLLLNV